LVFDYVISKYKNNVYRDWLDKNRSIESELSYRTVQCFWMTIYETIWTQTYYPEWNEEVIRIETVTYQIYVCLPVNFGNSGWSGNDDDSKDNKGGKGNKGRKDIIENIISTLDISTEEKECVESAANLGGVIFLLLDDTECYSSLKDDIEKAIKNMKDCTLESFNSEMDKIKKNKINGFLNKSFVKDLISNNSILDPCDPSKSTEDIINESINSKCLPTNLDGLMNDIGDSGDYIVKNLKNCPKVDCMLKKIMNISGNDICDKIKKIDKDKKHSVFMTSGNVTDGQGNSAYAETNMTGGLNIVFDTKLTCESNSGIDVAETILHEYLHAEFRIEMLKMGWDGKDASKNKYLDLYFQKLISQTGKSEHEVIAEYYLNPLAKALWELNGKKGKIIDYYGYVLNGLQDEKSGKVTNPILLKWGLSLQDIKYHYETSINVVPSNIKFDCT